jgi:hypothetical protein
VLIQLYKVKPLANGLAPRKLFPKGVPTMVGFDDGVDLLYAVQVRSPLISPVACAGDAKSRYLVEPQGVTVALSLYQDHVPDLACLFKEPEAVWAGLVPASPPELLWAIERDAEADTGLLAFFVRIGDTDGGLLEVGYISQA